MKTLIECGGPAFPVPEQHGQQHVSSPNGNQWEQGWEPAASGMTLRDWFAGMALQGMMACPVTLEFNDGTNTEKDGFAKCAYDQADAMLAEREKGNQ